MWQPLLARYDLESASRLLDRDAFRRKVPTPRYRSKAERWPEAETTASGLRVLKALGDFLILKGSQGEPWDSRRPRRR